MVCERTAPSITDRALECLSNRTFRWRINKEVLSNSKRPAQSHRTRGPKFPWNEERSVKKIPVDAENPNFPTKNESGLMLTEKLLQLTRTFYLIICLAGHYTDPLESLPKIFASGPLKLNLQSASGTQPRWRGPILWASNYKMCLHVMLCYVPHCFATSGPQTNRQRWYNHALTYVVRFRAFNVHYPATSWFELMFFPVCFAVYAPHLWFAHLNSTRNRI